MHLLYGTSPEVRSRKVYEKADQKETHLAEFPVGNVDPVEGS